METALITGGCGFLGRNLTNRLLADGCSVRVLDQRSGASSPGATYFVGDIRDAEVVEAALEGVDTVIHTAFAPPYRSRSDLESVNVAATDRLCAAAMARGVRLVLISSTIVEWPPRPHPLFRNSPLSRLDLYRWTRLRAEKVASGYAERGLSLAIVRPRTFLGAGQVSAFAILFEQVRQGGDVTIPGAGEHRYQMLDIRDMTQAIGILGGSEAQGTFHLGATRFGTVREEWRALIEHAGTGARLRHVPARAARGVLQVADVLGLAPFSHWHRTGAAGRDSVSDTSPAARALGWEPRYSNIEALVSSYDSYVESRRHGTTRTTHPVPLSHRILAGLLRLGRS